MGIFAVVFQKWRLGKDKNKFITISFWLAASIIKIANLLALVGKNPPISRCWGKLA